MTTFNWRHHHVRKYISLVSYNVNSIFNFCWCKQKKVQRIRKCVFIYFYLNYGFLFIRVWPSIILIPNYLQVTALTCKLNDKYITVTCHPDGYFFLYNFISEQRYAPDRFCLDEDNMVNLTNPPCFDRSYNVWQQWWRYI